MDITKRHPIRSLTVNPDPLSNDLWPTDCHGKRMLSGDSFSVHFCRSIAGISKEWMRK